MTSSHHAPYVLGYTRTTMVGNREQRTREGERTSKTRSQFGSQAATRLREVGIASNRRSAYCGEYVPGLPESTFIWRLLFGFEGSALKP